MVVFVAVETDPETVAAGLPLRPKNVVSNRCTLPTARPTEDAIFVASALAVRGRVPAGRTSIRQRLSAWPVFRLSTSLRWTSTRVSFLANLPKTRFTLPSTNRVRLASTAIVLSLLTRIFIAPPEEGVHTSLLFSQPRRSESDALFDKQPAVGLSYAAARERGASCRRHGSNVTAPRRTRLLDPRHGTISSYTARQITQMFASTV